MMTSMVLVIGLLSYHAYGTLVSGSVTSSDIGGLNYDYEYELLGSGDYKFKVIFTSMQPVWFGLGFSPTGSGMSGTDATIATVDGSTITLTDYYATATGSASADTDAFNFENSSTDVSGPVRTIEFTRPVDTGDASQDVVLSDSISLVYLIGDTSTFSKHKYVGFIPFNLLTGTPTESPTMSPTLSPSLNPTVSPTATAPTNSPVSAPSMSPTASPTISPTIGTTEMPTSTPSTSPTSSPSTSPTTSPSDAPSFVPSSSPTGEATTCMVYASLDVTSNPSTVTWGVYSGTTAVIEDKSFLGNVTLELELDAEYTIVVAGTGSLTFNGDIVFEFDSADQVTLALNDNEVEGGATLATVSCSDADLYQELSADGAISMGFASTAIISILAFAF